VPGQIEDDGHGAGGRQFGQRLDILELAERCKLQALAGDDADRAEKDQAAGRAEKSADHRIGYIADRTADPRHSAAAEHDAGRDGGEGKGEQYGREQRRRWIGRHDPLHHR
jgi:hypothetical protein